MKILLVAVNSKFTHTSLSVRSLSANAGGVDFVELTINEELNKSVSVIVDKKPDVICYSCYIWNIEYVKKLASVIKKINPLSLSIFGGPEVSFCDEEFLRENVFADAVVRGEGEETFRILAENGFIFENVEGVTYRHGDIIKNPDRLHLPEPESLVFPYTDSDLEKNRGKLIYYESSRGCPYNCSYCLSSTFHGVRFKSVEKVKNELGKLISFKPKTIKFVDRTFNADKKRTTEIINFLIKNGGNTTFHFEIEAHTLSEDFFEALRFAPDGMFRLEIGLQTTNPQALRAINRSDKVDKLAENIKRITSLRNVCVHLDLIAGLPYEDYKSFRRSFNDAMSLKPNELQLGFLKLLKGTKIREDSNAHGYVFCDFPPYEIIENSYISADELLLLKKIEELTDKFCNSGAFKLSLEFLEGFFGDYITFFEELTNHYDYSQQHSRDSLYTMLADFAKNKCADEVFFDILKYDYISSNVNAGTPDWSINPYDIEIHKKRMEYVEQYRGSVFASFGDMQAREIIKHVHFETFSYRFDKAVVKEKWVGVFEKHGRFLGEIVP